MAWKNIYTRDFIINIHKIGVRLNYTHNRFMNLRVSLKLKL